MDQVKSVREKAKVKTFIRGRIVLEAGKAGKELVFYTKQDPAGKLVKHVNQFFGRSVSKLKKAIFRKIENEVATADDTNEFSEEGDVATLRNEMASFSEFDSQTSVQIRVLFQVDGEARR